MKPIEHPDNVGQRWWELGHLVSSAKAMNPATVAGRCWARTCAREGCGSTVHRWAWSAYFRRHMERCARCGEPWIDIDQDVPKVQRRRKEGAPPNTADRSLVEFVTFDALLRRLPEPDQTLYLFYLDPRQGGYGYAAGRAVEQGLLERARIGHARRAVERARETLDFYLREAAARGELVYEGMVA